MQIVHLNAFFPGYFVFKNENVKVKVNYGFVLHTGFAGPPFYFRIITSYLKKSGIPCCGKLFLGQLMANYSLDESLW